MLKVEGGEIFWAKTHLTLDLIFLTIIFVSLGRTALFASASSRQPSFLASRLGVCIQTKMATHSSKHQLVELLVVKNSTGTHLGFMVDLQSSLNNSLGKVQTCHFRDLRGIHYGGSVRVGEKAESYWPTYCKMKQFKSCMTYKSVHRPCYRVWNTNLIFWWILL